MQVKSLSVVAFNLFCLLDFDFPLVIHLPYHVYDQLSVLQCHHNITAMEKVIT